TAGDRPRHRLPARPDRAAAHQRRLPAGDPHPDQGRGEFGRRAERRGDGDQQRAAGPGTPRVVPDHRVARVPGPEVAPAVPRRSSRIAIMTRLAPSRRRFLRAASALSTMVPAAGSGLALTLATLGTAAAQSAGDYKALVCVFLFGGCDYANT